MAINFNAINSKMSRMAREFQTPELLGAAEDMKSKLQASSESIFKNTEGLQESLTAKFSAPDLLAKLPTGGFSPAELESKLKGLGGEVKGGMQMVGPIAADLADKAKILEPQLAAVSQDIADKLPAMKEAISDTDLANADKMFTAATSGDTAIDIEAMFPDVQATVENVAEMNFDITTTANLEGVTTALQTAIPDLPLEDLSDVMGDLVPTDILGVGSFDPLSMMQDFQGGADLKALSSATNAAKQGFENSLGGLSGGGLLMGVLEAEQSVLSNTVFSKVPNFPEDKIKNLVESFASGDSKQCRTLAIGNIELSEELKEKLDEADIPSKFGSIEDIQDIISNASILDDIFTGKLLSELGSLQDTVSKVFDVFPDKLPSPGSFLKAPNPIPKPTTEVIDFKGGRGSNTTSRTKDTSTATTKTTEAGTTTTVNTPAGVKIVKAPVVSKVSTTSDLKGSGAVQPTTVIKQTATGQETVVTNDPKDPTARAEFHPDGSATLPADATDAEVAATQEKAFELSEKQKAEAVADAQRQAEADDLSNQEAVILYNIQEIVALLKSSSRAFSTLLFDWTGTYSDQNMTAHDVHDYYKSSGKPQGIPYHLLIRKDGKIEQGRFLDQLPLIKAGYNEHAIGVGVVAGYDTPAPKDGPFQGGVLTSKSVSNLQFNMMKRIHAAFKMTVPLGQTYGVNELNADRESPNPRQGPGVDVANIRSHRSFPTEIVGDVISNGGFFSIEELKTLIEAKTEGED